MSTPIILRAGLLALVLATTAGCAGSPLPSALPVADAQPKPRPTRSGEQLALRRKAADLTKRGTELRRLAAEERDVTQAQSLLDRATSIYRDAAAAWAGALASEPTASNDARFWLADAWNKVVRLEWALHLSFPTERGVPSPEDLAQALAASTAARDANLVPDFVSLAAAYVVEVADIARDVAYAQYDASGGTVGIPRRRAVVIHGAGASSSVEVVGVPAPVLQSILARVAYVRRVTHEGVAFDGKPMASTFTYEAAETYYLHGHLDEARAVLDSVESGECPTRRVSMRSWELLLDIVTKQHDEAGLRRVANVGQRCYLDPNPDAAPAGPLICGASFMEADIAFKAACGRELLREGDRCDPVTPALTVKWRIAAVAYESVFDAEPSARDAPTSALRAAFAREQAGEIESGIALLRRFISAYGDEAILQRLDYGILGTAEAKKPYRERLEFLGQAYDQGSSLALLGFDPSTAVGLQLAAASSARFDGPRRRDYLINALLLLAALGERARFDASLALLRTLDPTPTQRARAELVRAELDLEQGKAGDVSAASAARKALATYYRDHRDEPFASAFVFRAAWELARLAVATHDGSYRTWLENARAARVSWSRNVTPDDRASYDAAGPTFAQLEREIHPVHVTASTSLAEVFGPATEASSGQPWPLAP